MELTYPLDALQPFMSRETLEYHYGKHHKAYVDKLNSLIPGTEFENMMLEEIITSAKQWPIFNNAAQIWNHNFFWDTLKINNWSMPWTVLMEKITQTFWSFDTFKEKFKNEAIARFGSGWVWLVDRNGQLEIYSTPNAENPLTLWGKPVLGCDVWEHSYYIDYRNDRAKFIDNFWNIVDWEKIDSL